MDYKKTAASYTTITRDIDKFDAETQNIYESVIIATRRANQISVEMKQELNAFLSRSEIEVISLNHQFNDGIMSVLVYFRKK